MNNGQEAASKEANPRDSVSHEGSHRGSRWVWLLLGGGLLAVLIGVLLAPGHDRPTTRSSSADASGVEPAARSLSRERARQPQRRSDPAASQTAAEIVTHKVSQFGRDRRAIAHAMARRAGIEVPDEVERFFDAVETGNWEEIEARLSGLHQRCAETLGT